jgi:TonB-linked SusC/RagA family outer membrane protein
LKNIIILGTALLRAMMKSILLCFFLVFVLKCYGQQAIQDSLENVGTTFNAVSKLSREDFNQGIIHLPYHLINGRVTGIGMSAAGNDPNGEFVLRVRGLSTLQRDTKPLLVVDGFVVDDLQLVDPNDIAQVTLLKDGAAASAYGVQGANGVLMITTRKSDELSNVSFQSTFGIAKSINKIEALSAGAYKQFPASVDMGSSQDWLDLITQTGISSVNNLAVSRNTGSFSVRASVNSRVVKGTLLGTGFDQLNFRINLQQRAMNDRLRLQMRLASSTRDADFGFREALKYAYSSNPTMQVHDPSSPQHGGYKQSQVFDNFNPIAIIEQNTNSGKDKSSSISFGGDYEFNGKLKGIVMKLSYQLLNMDYFNGRYYSRQSFYIGAYRNGLASTNSDKREMHQFDAALNYVKNLKNINFEISSGYRFQDHTRSTALMEGGDFLTDAYSYHNMGASQDFQNGIGTVSSSVDAYKVVSWRTNASVFFKEKYFIGASTNYSGSTRLGSNNKWGLFPAITGGIQFTEGIAMLSHLRIRASWGKAGNIPQQSNLAGSKMSAGGFMYYNGNYIPAYFVSRDANPDLKWEEKSEVSIGADFMLLNDNVQGSIDWFRNKVQDLISPVSVPSPPSISNSMVANLGELQNSGLEINLNVSARKTRQFSWDIDFNFSHVTTKVNSLHGDDVTLTENGKLSIGVLTDASGGCSSHGVNLVEEGAKLGQIQGPIFTGIGPDGYPQHKDINGDAAYCDCPDDFVVLGNALPKFLFGFGSRFTYKNFELRFLLRGASGHHKINSYRIHQEGTAIVSSYNLVETSYFDPRLQHTHLSSNYVEKASFITLDNISLGYHVPTKLKLTVLFTIQNLFTITKYTGSDPEVAYGNSLVKGQTVDPGNPSPLVNGLDLRGSYLPSRIFSVGLGLKL